MAGQNSVFLGFNVNVIVQSPGWQDCSVLGQDPDAPITQIFTARHEINCQPQFSIKVKKPRGASVAHLVDHLVDSLSGHTLNVIPLFSHPISCLSLSLKAKSPLLKKS